MCRSIYIEREGGAREARSQIPRRKMDARTLELNKSLIFFKFFRNEEARDDGFKLGAIYPSMERSHGSARAFLAVLRLLPDPIAIQAEIGFR